MFGKLFGKITHKKELKTKESNIFNKVFGEVTIKTVRNKKKGLCLEASNEGGTKILMDFYENDTMDLPDGSNAYFFGNKLIIVTRWSNMSDEEKQKVEEDDLALAIHPYQCAQLSLKVGKNWGDVMVTLPHCYSELNDENAPVDEAIFIFADTQDSDYITCRSVLLPAFVQKFLQRCNVNSHKMLALDNKIMALRMMAEQDPSQDFYDYLYDMCWEETEEFYDKARNSELDNIPDGLYIEIGSGNKVTNVYQHEYVKPNPMSNEVKLYMELAQKGFDEAQYNLGVCYEQGDGIAQDFEQAVYWYKKAAAQGYARAQYNLGICLYNGYGTETDYAEAARLFRLAAEQGHMNAQYSMGVCYYNGEGVEENESEAMEWLRKAAEQGHPEAKRVLEQN